MIGKVIVGRLTGQTSAANRVYPLFLPQYATYPAVTYHTVSTSREHAFSADASVRQVRVQVDCWSDKYSTARTLADEVLARLSRFAGTVNATTVQDVILDNEREIFEPDTLTHRVSQDYIAYLND